MCRQLRLGADVCDSVDCGGLGNTAEEDDLAIVIAADVVVLFSPEAAAGLSRCGAWGARF